MSREEAPPAIVGFFEGLMVPVGELLITLAFTIGFTVTEQLEGDPSMLILLFVVVGIIEFVRHILIGLNPGWFAGGHVVGSIVGIAIFYTFVDQVSHEAASQTAYLTIVLIVSFCLGVALMIYRRSNP